MRKMQEVSLQITRRRQTCENFTERKFWSTAMAVSLPGFAWVSFNK